MTPMTQEVLTAILEIKDDIAEIKAGVAKTEERQLRSDLDHREIKREVDRLKKVVQVGVGFAMAAGGAVGAFAEKVFGFL